ncbi:hypothetical protein QBC36DRAFT_289444 [Triangularia setosa]|uniref:Uncharacterized protein n=1 Tax=Triangularia setosa TaxID=2587417 RepID=A0AAN7A9L9_9PEZI|nr:hypothetical protein QBC36DRAFT_289444 [Podospora setosa]
MQDRKSIYESVKLVLSLIEHIGKLLNEYTASLTTLHKELDDIASEHDFKISEASTRMVRAKDSGDHVPLVAGWIYHLQLKIAQSETVVEDIASAMTGHSTAPSGSESLGWVSEICSRDITPERLGSIEGRVIKAKRTLTENLRTIKHEIDQIKTEIEEIYDNPGGIPWDDLLAWNDKDFDSDNGDDDDDDN